MLDAISFALYGKSSGGMREDLRSMRCQLAGEGDITFVILNLKQGGGGTVFAAACGREENAAALWPWKRTKTRCFGTKRSGTPFLKSEKSKCNQKSGGTHRSKLRTVSQGDFAPAGAIRNPFGSGLGGKGKNPGTAVSGPALE